MFLQSRWFEYGSDTEELINKASLTPDRGTINNEVRV